MPKKEGVIREVSELRDRARIRHYIRPKESTRECIVNAPENKVEYQGIKYSLCGFVKKHFVDVHPTRKPNANVWKDCEIERVGGGWESIHLIPKP
jgi:hypothetical protein